MWTNVYISKQLKFRLAPLVKIKIEEEHPFTKGCFTAFYKYKDEKILAYNYKPEGTLIGNFVISALVKNDPKDAIEFDGRTGEGTFGKRLVINKCGENDLEKFNYISELLYQVIKNFQ